MRLYNLKKGRQWRLSLRGGNDPEIPDGVPQYLPKDANRNSLLLGKDLPELSTLGRGPRATVLVPSPRYSSKDRKAS